jgi:hypothetical protein
MERSSSVTNEQREELIQLAIYEAFGCIEVELGSVSNWWRCAGKLADYIEKRLEEEERK